MPPPPPPHSIPILPWFQSRQRSIRPVIRQCPPGTMEADRQQSDLPVGLVPTHSACGCYSSSPTFQTRPLHSSEVSLRDCFKNPLLHLHHCGQSPTDVLPQHRAHRAGSSSPRLGTKSRMASQTQGLEEGRSGWEEVKIIAQFQAFSRAK